VRRQCGSLQESCLEWQGAGDDLHQRHARLLISTVNVKLDWDAMIGTLAPNGRLHLVGAVL
jgi:hypothetical protein